MNTTPPPRRHASRGQAHTLEGFFAALLLLSAVLFALNATAVTPLTSSTASRHVQNQQAAVGSGFLVAEQNQDHLKQAVLFWDPPASPSQDGQWHNKDDGVSKGYTSTDEITQSGFLLGQSVYETFVANDVAVNIAIEYRPNNDDGIYELIDFGEPTTNAVTQTAVVVLYDSDVIYDENGDPTSTTLGSLGGDEYFAADQSPGPIYNVVTVKLTLWRV
jgi:hypothetical protein